MRLFLNVTTGLRLFALVFISTLTASTFAAIPNLEANQDERSLSNPSYVLGQHWFRQLNGSRALIDFPPAYDYFKDTLSKILPQTSLYNKTVEMTFLNSSQSNAFVIPGNHMFIYSDIMEIITNEEMLLGLLSHELAHLDLRHYERQKQYANQELQKTLALIGAGIAVALAGADGDATTALWLGGIANQAENKLTYSRNQEQEADRQGRQYLTEAGLSADGMSQLFQAFFKQALGRPKLEFLSTHPSPDTRLSDSFSAESKETILNYKAPTDFEYFRASLLAYRAGLEEQPYDYLNQKIQNENVKNFAKGLFSYLVNTPERSLVFLEKLDQRNRFTDYLQALSFIATNQNKRSLNVINQQLEIAPKNIIFSILKAEVNKSLPQKIPSDYLYEKRMFWRANIQYYKSINNIPMALHYRALLDFSQGKDKTAINLNERAQNNTQDNGKDIIRETGVLFKKIKNVEKQQGIGEE